MSAIELIDYDRQEPLPPPAVPATPSASLVETPARHLTFGPQWTSTVSPSVAYAREAVPVEYEYEYVEPVEPAEPRLPAVEPVSDVSQPLEQPLARFLNTPSRVKAAASPAAAVCPFCVAELQRPDFCGSCKSAIWPLNPVEFALSRPVERDAIQRFIDAPSPMPSTVDRELLLTLAYCNLQDFAKAREHLERAVVRNFAATAIARERVGVYLTREPVLVVDDSATIRDVLVRLLDSDGYLPVPVAVGWDLMNVAAAMAPVAILLDITMPGVDGLDLCRQIRSNKATKSIPIIIVSGHGDLLDKVVGKLAGASDYLTKPFQPNQLLSVVRRHANKHR